jgi:hypothetical protein
MPPESPLTADPSRRSERGILTAGGDTLYLNGDQYYSADPCWTPYGDHGMRAIGECYICYSFEFGTVCLDEGSLELGVKFASWAEETWVMGPSLWAWSHTAADWVLIAHSMGNQDEIIWKWYPLPAPANQWVDRDGRISFCVESTESDEVVVDEVGATVDRRFPDLVISAVWVEPHEFCPLDSTGLGFTVKNIGECKAASEFYCDMWLDAYWLGFVFIDSLDAGDSLSVVLHDFTWPDDEDTHLLIGQADTDDLIQESNEDNNVTVESIATKPRPPTPANVQASDGAHLDKVEISWDAASGATGYAIYRDTTLLAQDWPGITYDDLGALPQTVHTYKVYSCNECGCSSEFGSDSGHKGAVMVSVPMSSGWNWFSLNAESDDMSLDNVLASLGAAGSYIKDQTAFSEYVTEWSAWFGTLAELTCETTYLIRMNEAATLSYTGYQYDRSTPMSLDPGWNWISYLPTTPMSLDDALASLDANGTYIKNQTDFSEYVTEWSAWFGTLTEMQPSDGYKIQMAAADVLIYPEPPPPTPARTSTQGPEQAQASAHALVPASREPLARGRAHPVEGMAGWSTEPSAYEFNGSVIASVTAGDAAEVAPGDILAAFVNGECRGLQSAVAAPDGGCLFCLMVYSNAVQGETISFKYYDSEEGTTYDVAESLTFSADMVRGRALSPIRLTAQPAGRDPKTAIPLETALHRNHPNPFSEETGISFSIGRVGHVTIEIFNIQGEVVRVLVNNDLAPGNHNVVWDRRNESGVAVSSGFYFCRMRTSDYVSIQKLTLLQ